MTQQQPQGPQVQEQPDAFKAVAAAARTSAEWWRQLEAIMRPKEAKP